MSSHAKASVCAAAAVLATMLALEWRRRRRPIAAKSVLELIGDTPLLELRSLSEATGCTILGKAEFLNPGGSSKDRVALEMVREAAASGKLSPGGTLVEATQGSTGVSLALVARASGYRCLLVTGDDVSEQKLQMMRALGANVDVVKPAAIANPDHPVNVARRRAAELGPGSMFCNQFDNLANTHAHERTTAREVSVARRVTRLPQPQTHALRHRLPRCGSRPVAASMPSSCRPVLAARSQESRASSRHARQARYDPARPPRSSR